MHYCEQCDDPVRLTPLADDTAVCGRCGAVSAVRKRQLFMVVGASASGKTTVLPDLIAALPECAVFDVDWLIDPMTRASLPDPVDWASFRATWLAVAHGLAQGGRSTVLLGPFIPENLEGLPERQWITDIRFALLDCADDVRRSRLEARPRWRERNIDEHLAFAAHLRGPANLDGPTIRTDLMPPGDVARDLAAWVRSHL